jgi:hypothetical protein
MSRRLHFRPEQVSRLTREPPFTDARVAELIATILRKPYAAMDPKEVSRLCRCWNQRHDRLFAEQEERDRAPEGKDIDTFNRHAGAARGALLRIRRRRQRELEAARASGAAASILTARTRLREANQQITIADLLCLPRNYITPDWLDGWLDEIEAALRVTNPNKRLGRSKESAVVLIGEAAIEPITGMVISAETIAQQVARRRRSR